MLGIEIKHFRSDIENDKQGSSMKINRVLTTVLTAVSIAVLGMAISSEILAKEAVSLRGEYVQGGLIIGQAADVKEVKKVMFDSRQLKLSEEGDFAFGFGRDAAAAHELVIVLEDGSRIVKKLEITKREYRIQKIEGISKKVMNPSKSNLERIRAENASVKKARQTDDARTDFMQDFKWPLLGEITGVYGSQRVFNGVPKRPHYGVDVAAPVGTQIVSPADGVVTLYHPNMFYSGGTLIVDHGHGISSTFIHLKRGLVKVGQHVKQGEIIAETGASGRATGPHLDWRMNWFNVRLDPVLVVGTMPSAGKQKRPLN